MHKSLCGIAKHPILVVSISWDRGGWGNMLVRRVHRASIYSLIAKPEIDIGISKMFHFFKNLIFYKICIM